MPFFVLFVLGAVMLGAGAMLAPAWHSSAPRIGLSATFCLAFVLAGTFLGTYVWGWRTLTVDYVLFGGVSFVVLGGTLSQAQTRAEAKGEILDDAQMGWIQRADLLLFALVGAISALFLLRPTAPLEHTGWAFSALSAYLSLQLRQALPVIEGAMSSFFSLLTLWVLFDLGAEWRDTAFGRKLALGAALVVWGLQLGGFAPLVLALAFLLSGATFALRAFRHGIFSDRLASVVLLVMACFSYQL